MTASVHPFGLKAQHGGGTKRDNGSRRGQSGFGCNGASCTDGLPQGPLSRFGANLRLNPFRIAADKDGRRASVLRVSESGSSCNISALQSFVAIETQPH